MRARSVTIAAGALLFVFVLASDPAEAHGRFYFSFGWGSSVHAPYAPYGYAYRPYAYWHGAYPWAPYSAAVPAGGYYYHYGRPPAYKVYRRVVVSPPGPRGHARYRTYTPRGYGRVYTR
jgi:hypothetical protein